ncbi:MAG: hypothetical protein IIX68_02185, partial [Clostridia bacterium]|nr:hypothetical protein [Clostridia bacterium]
PVSHPLDSPLGEGAKKDCAYAPQNLHNLSASRRVGQIVVNFLQIIQIGIYWKECTNRVEKSVERVEFFAAKLVKSV